MIERLEKIEQRYNEIFNELIDPKNISNVSNTLKLSKEQASLKEVYDLYQEYKKVLSDLKDAKELSKDKELGDYAKEEVIRLEAEQSRIEKEIEFQLLPKDPNDGKDVIVEIRGAVGGDEGNIFAGDLYHMYFKYAERQGFKLELIEAEEASSGGYTLVIFKLKGKNVYSHLKYESGAHRVQRVPVTETQGRIHTSTATVLVMPEAEDLEIQISPNDIRVDVFRSGGCGGQGVNTTDSAVRITHIPSGLVVTCQNERSQIQNRETCMQMLKTRLYDKEMQEKEAKESSERKSKIGTGDRCEKIRTYNYPQNRVTDHRIGFTIQKLDRVMEGELDEIIEALNKEEQLRQIKGE